MKRIIMAIVAIVMVIGVTATLTGCASEETTIKSRTGAVNQIDIAEITVKPITIETIHVEEIQTETIETENIISEEYLSEVEYNSQENSWN